MVDVVVDVGVNTSMYTTTTPAAMIMTIIMTVIMGVIALLTLVEGILSTTARSQVLSRAHVNANVLRNLTLEIEIRISLISFRVLLT